MHHQGLHLLSRVAPVVLAMPAKARVTSSDDVPLQMEADGAMPLRRQALALLAGSLGQIFECIPLHT